MTDNNDEVLLMQWMNVDQLAAYNDLLSQIERADADLVRWHDEIKAGNPDPNAPLSEEQRGKYVEILGRWVVAHQAQANLQRTVLDCVEGQLRGWETLLPWTLTAIETLANKGVTPSSAGGQKEYFKSLYVSLVHKHATQLATLPEFKYVRVVEFLSGPFSNRCPRLAEEYRQRGELYLAQLLDSLSSE